jgi:chemotaxis protein MotB
MVRRRREEIHINNERWLVSYADFITLLFAFFVVMYSISQVSETKYRALTETLGTAFHQPSKQPVVANEQTPSSPIDAGAHEGPSVIDLEDEIPVPPESVPTVDELAQISDLVSDKFSELINQEVIHVASNELWLQIELKDSILFDSGSAEASVRARQIFTDIAAILKQYSNPIQVEGFTDNVPIRSEKYPTNWELSTARASTIVKFFIDEGIIPDRLAAVGYGEFQPVASNTTEQGRAQNRRIAIMVAKRKMERPTLR